MTIDEFLTLTQDEIREETARRVSGGEGEPYPESVFTEVVMTHLAEVGITSEPVVCHYEGTVANARLRLSGYAFSDEGDDLDLFVSLYKGYDEVTPIDTKEIQRAGGQCFRFVTRCAEGRLAANMEEAHPAYHLAVQIEACFSSLARIKIYVLTDGQKKKWEFKSRTANDKLVRLEVVDIERLHRHWNTGKPRDELTVNFRQLLEDKDTQTKGDSLPCVYVPNEMENYDYALTAIPGEALRRIYERYGSRLLEANVRSFLSASGKVNKGIRDTLKNNPQRFMAYNNGIVIVADELSLRKTNAGGPGIEAIRGLQIVNGGQTTASLYFTARKDHDVDLRHVRVPAKIVILKTTDEDQQEELISSISRYANSQTTVKQSDLSSNRPFHVEVEKLAASTYCPDGVGRWFYERSSGSYKTMLAREGTTPARLKQLKHERPVARKLTKTDLARTLNTWDQMPHTASLGLQKNFIKFMDAMDEKGDSLPDVASYKNMIAKTILFKQTYKLVRSQKLPQSHMQVACYVVSLVAHRLGDQIDLNRIWQEQDISTQLKDLLEQWIPQVDRVLHTSAGGKQISEWAKKTACWDAVRATHYRTSGLNTDKIRW